MDTATRLKNLDAWKIKKNIEENAKRLAEEEKQAKTIADIEALWPRAQAVIELYNACLDKGMPFPKTRYNDWTNDFFSNSWSHFLGVGRLTQEQSHGADKTHVNAISIRGGGACNYEIDFADGTVFATGSDKWSRLYNFVNEFEKFEHNFYEWFDKAVQK